jgi:hypothetical protein
MDKKTNNDRQKTTLKTNDWEGPSCRHRMVIGFTTIYARGGYSIQHFVIKFVSDLRHVGGFLYVYSGFLRQQYWPPLYNWNTVERGVKHRYPNPNPRTFCISRRNSTHLSTRFLTSVIRLVSFVEQEPLPLQEQLRSTPDVSRVRVAQS